MTEVAIQGRQDHAQWVTAFKLSYSLDGNNFQFQEKVGGSNKRSREEKRYFFAYFFFC